MPDWSGRTQGYRQAIADLYTRARVPEAELDTVQAALRYHVGNLLRERASADELEATGLKPTSPKERLAVTRHALQAQRAKSAAPQDIARITTYAQALLEFVDTEAIPNTEADRLVASRIALENIRSRAIDLLTAVTDALGTPTVERAAGSGAGRHRRRGALVGV